MMLEKVDQQRHAGRVYIDGSGLTVHRVMDFKQWRLEQIQRRVEHATNWSVGPYTPVEFANGLLIKR